MPNCCPKELCNVTLPPSVYEGCYWYTSSPIHGIVSLSNFNCSECVVVLIFISMLMILNNFPCAYWPFLCLLLRIFLVFLLCWFVFLVLTFKSSFYVFPGNSFFVRCIYCKCVLPVRGLPSKAECLIFKKSFLTNFFLLWFVLSLSCLRNLCLLQIPKYFLLYFLLEACQF